MKNNIDYIYEYSDLNLFNTRVKLLTGDYKGMVLEFGGSGLLQWVNGEESGNKFNFDYTIFDMPDESKSNIKGKIEFEQYLCDLLITIIEHRRNDKKAHDKLMEAASKSGVKNSKIKIDKKWYKKKVA